MLKIGTKVIIAVPEGVKPKMNSDLGWKIAEKALMLGIEGTITHIGTHSHSVDFGAKCTRSECQYKIKCITHPVIEKWLEEI